MHCPQCGQQQVSGELRFCSRCGFPLAGVNELLATGGNLPSLEVPTGKGRHSPRYEGVRQGVIMFFLGAVIVPLLGILYSFQGNDSSLLEILVPISAVLFFVGGFVRILYALIFEEGTTPSAHLQNTSLPYVPPVASSQLSAGARGTALPPAQSIPVSSWRQPHNTAEIVRPPSVTENTTRLLNDQPEQPPR
ncbi:MAG TPA: hypothetical protein VF658_09505 [Pyrinomonadaceae bacterium]|jgi:hypothetical protein